MSADVGLGWASLGLQTISTIGAASGQARANRATIKGNNKAIKLLDENLSLLPEIAQSRKEGAMSDLNLAMGQAGYEGRESSITAFQDYENALGSTGFAADYSMQDAYGDFQRKLNDNFMQQRKSLFSSLDNSNFPTLLIDVEISSNDLSILEIPFSNILAIGVSVF